MSDADADAEVTEIGALLAPAYRTLGQLYLEPPDERTVRAIQQWCDAFADESLPPELEAAVETVRTADPELDVLRGAFTRLLQGVSYGEAVPPPYESMYVDEMLNGPSSTEVEAFYYEVGVTLDVDDELIDHAGYELSFLAELCDRGDREAQLGFIRTHVGDWLTEFHEAARGEDPPAFYRGLFALTESLLELHADTLEES
ncbi:TorD/DmsD family molecular chaperone [Natrialbaceae archaeon AArc-T1-2]|uniref:TorD/DmsD family molecular chaperone n=1 Tax=Natrialbaceae archaeon AArc-T1-2 TaxID=3053904 RepID=UPI00255B23D1|nr:molecular chaperone TorD family protein [Natrialbaceae archaeon AArc-T1-2]WIV66485.1 molecular chaperone TorD family protein [Natrialbaceae archaeon AArc-T1-2]